MPFEKRPSKLDISTMEFKKAIRDNQTNVLVEHIFRHGINTYEKINPLHFVLEHINDKPADTTCIDVTSTTRVENRIAINNQLAKLFLSHGIMFDKKNIQGQSPIDIAKKTNNQEMINYLTKIEALFFACQNGDAIKTTELLEAGTSQWVCNKYGESPLHVAVDHNHIQIVIILLKNGACINDKNRKNEIPLTIAKKNQFRKITTLLQKHHSLFYAIKNENLTREMIDRDINLQIRNDYNNTPLHEAAYAGNLDAVKILLEKGASIDIRGHFGNYPIHTAARRKQDKIVHFLHEQGANLECSDWRGSTPLALAVFEGAYTTIDLLFALNANKETRDHYGYTILHHAAEADNPDMIEYLYSKFKLNLEATDHYARTPLLVAAWTGKEKAIKKLIALGANYRAIDNKGRNMFHCFARQGREDLFSSFTILDGREIRKLGTDEEGENYLPDLVPLFEMTLAKTRDNTIPLEEARAHNLNFPENVNGENAIQQINIDKLFHAITLNQLPYIRQYIALFPECNFSTLTKEDGITPLHHLLLTADLLPLHNYIVTFLGMKNLAMSPNDFIECLTLLSTKYQTLDVPDCYGNTPLFLAIKLGGQLGYIACEMLLKAGAKADFILPNNMSSLPFACLHNPNPVFFDLLVKHGVNLLMTSQHRQTLLTFLLENHENEEQHHHDIFPLAIYLYEKGVTYDPKFKGKMIYIVTRQNRLDLLEQLNPQRDEEIYLAEGGYSALHVAQNRETAERLINAGFDPNEQENETHATPLHLAIYRHNNTMTTTEISRDLIEYLAEHTGINRQNEKNRTIMHIAIEMDIPFLVDLLLKKQPNLELTDNKNRTPLYTAINLNLLQLTEKLLKAGANAECIVNNKTPLELIASCGIYRAHKANVQDANTCFLLLQHGANYRNCMANLLTTAILANHQELFNLLLSKDDINVNEFNGEKLTPLQISAIFDREGYYINALITHGTEIEKRHKDTYRTALGFASRNQTAFKILLENGANIHVTDDNNHTILYWLINHWPYASENNQYYTEDKEAILNILLEHHVTITQEELDEIKQESELSKELEERMNEYLMPKRRLSH